MMEVSAKAKQTKFVWALKSVMMDNKNFDINILRANADKRRLNIYNNKNEIRNEIVEVYNYFQRDDKRVK